ncbi:DUF1642 domain-containing protein [Listeria seeligeri]|uniref:DUF1642 domain-containing protein n=1 Tax=Listeria seeligeri TaxID=1640 RepID=UPI001624199C|nr:DUF1642 domain-containing protein [Listeria seeligeri]MBC1851183.1 DUF1642 domain-containing protein [Listeria seeligeri]MBC1929333.1 DUF1642 domain-containing protein [Listeria seeligeri]MBF2370279.1 DUF1642 domain-containing protein [Listeria seeligeri]
MKFKKGDRVEGIWRSELIQGVVAHISEITNELNIKPDFTSQGTILFNQNQVSKVELVKVPKFVADAIDTFKDEGDGLAVAIDYEVYTEALIKELSLDIKMRAWLWETSNQELFARAWIDGYEVEQEPLYYVQFPIFRLNTLGTAVEGDYKYLWADPATGESGIFQSLEYPATLIKSGWKTKFTEEQIKNMDKRYWAFAVPVEE